jgi:hypothetical protein
LARVAGFFQRKTKSLANKGRLLEGQLFRGLRDELQKKLNDNTKRAGHNAVLVTPMQVLSDAATAAGPITDEEVEFSCDPTFKILLLNAVLELYEGL